MGLAPGTNDSPFPFGTVRGDAGRIALTSVSLDGDITGLLFTASIRQEYENKSTKNLEVIYTFPMGWDTALLGMSAEIGDRRLEGRVVEANEAEEGYEEALAQGNSAIMVEKSAKGLYTANLGNLLPNERVVVELKCARLLRFEQGRVRLVVPTVISERYGDPYAQGGLAPHETARVDPSVHYTFGLTLTLHGAMARATVNCPSHTIVQETVEDGVRCVLDHAALDRDVVVLLDGLSTDSCAQYVVQENEVLVAASFAPTCEETAENPLALKILVDCSGSMEGERIEQAKQGITAVLSALQASDLVSYSCFGSQVQRVLSKLSPCTAAVVRNLSLAVNATEANMGGTEMRAALENTFAISSPEEIQPMVLCITDGDVWDVENIVQTAKKSGHRVFAIGVGSAPSESLLRELAEQTGGACEFVTSNESMADAVVRMVHRMRGSVLHSIRVDWHCQPLWQSATPRFLYNGETAHFFALTREMPSSAPVLHFCAHDGAHSLAATTLEQTTSEDLFRLAMARRVEETAEPDEKQKLALAYQLVSEYTSLLLVCERDQAQKSKHLPTPQQVPQMPAAGHGSFRSTAFCGFVGGGDILSSCLSASNVPLLGHAVSFGPVEEQIHPADPMPGMFDFFVEHFVARSLHCTTISECMEDTRKSEQETWTFLSDLAREFGLDMNAVWAIFLAWLSEQTHVSVSRHGRRLLRASQRSVANDVCTKVRARCEAWATEHLIA